MSTPVISNAWASLMRSFGKGALTCWPAFTHARLQIKQHLTQLSSVIGHLSGFQYPVHFSQLVQSGLQAWMHQIIVCLSDQKFWKGVITWQEVWMLLGESRVRFLQSPSYAHKSTFIQEWFQWTDFRLSVHISIFQRTVHFLWEAVTLSSLYPVLFCLLNLLCAQLSIAFFMCPCVMHKPLYPCCNSQDSVESAVPVQVEQQWNYTVWVSHRVLNDILHHIFIFVDHLRFSFARHAIFQPLRSVPPERLLLERLGTRALVPHVPRSAGFSFPEQFSSNVRLWISLTRFSTNGFHCLELLLIQWGKCIALSLTFRLFDINFPSLAPINAPINSNLGNVIFFSGATLVLEAIRLVVHSPFHFTHRRQATAQ